MMNLLPISDKTSSAKPNTISNEDFPGNKKNIKEETKRQNRSKTRVYSIAVVNGLVARLGLPGSIISI